MLARDLQEALFRDISRETLDRDPAVVYAVDGRNRLFFVNKAWDAFARANSGESLTSDQLTGVDICEGSEESLRSFYVALFDHVRTHSKPVDHMFECSSGSLYRELRMRVMPLASSNGLLIVNSVVIERPHNISPVSFAADRYVDASGLITMCASCRRTRQASLAAWDWVPDLVERNPRQLSYSLCNLCREYYYIERRAVRARVT